MVVVALATGTVSVTVVSVEDVVTVSVTVVSVEDVVTVSFISGISNPGKQPT